MGVEKRDRLKFDPDNVLHDNDGGALSLADAIATHGFSAIQHSLLHSVFYQVANEPRLRGYPPKVFLSYRRESQASISIASFLATELRNNGFDVLFDEDDLMPDELGLGVTRFVARLAECHIFVPVITDAYLEDNDILKSTTMSWWIHEESQLAIDLQTNGLLQVVCIWLASRPPPQQPTNWYFGHVQIIDMRSFDPAALRRELSYRGMRLNDEDQQQLLQSVGSFQTAYDQGFASETARVLAGIPNHLADLEEVLVMRVQQRAICGYGDFTEALEKLASAAEMYPPNRARLLDALFKIDDPSAILRAGWPLLHFKRAPWRARVHMAMGYALGDRGVPLGAVNHLHRVLQLANEQDANWRAGMLNNIGSFLMDCGEFAAAGAHLEAASQADPTDWMPIYNLIRCLASQGRMAEAIDVRNRAIGRFPDEGIEIFVMKDPTRQPATASVRFVANPRSDRGCSVCAACFPVAAGSMLCAACGTPNPSWNPGSIAIAASSRAPDRCRACGYTEFNPQVWRDGRYHDLCPVCREGTLSTGNRTHLQQT